MLKLNSNLVQALVRQLHVMVVGELAEVIELDHNFCHTCEFPLSIQNWLQKIRERKRINAEHSQWENLTKENEMEMALGKWVGIAGGSKMKL